jgi:phosphoribosyl 1,2-cyclic phosphodiesterase
MGLYFSSLNSGSNANCYYIGNESDAVLVDAGLSCRETEKRMYNLGLPMERVRAIFISHEHADHINGLPLLSKKHRLPVYITPKTQRSGGFSLQPELYNTFSAREAVTIGNLQITGFLKPHDAADPHSFIISDGQTHIGVFTDIGHANKEVIHFFKQCHGVFLEANYCENMLAAGSYPAYLKKRISGRRGHLSNTQALALFTQHRTPHLQYLVLSHLSENNNDTALVKRMFTAEAGKTKIHVASRHEESPLFFMEAKPQLKQEQLRLF